VGLDYERDCIEHVWHLQELVLSDGESNEEWACRRCTAVDFRQPMNWRETYLQQEGRGTGQAM
jgi:hypothetical protein